MQISPTSSRRTGHGLEGRASRAIAGVAFTVLGLGMIALFSGFLEEWLSARRWQATQCEIMESFVAVNRAGRRPGYRVVAKYRYEVGPDRFVGLRYRLDEAFSPGRDAKDEIVRGMPAGSRVPCWYNPAEPSQAVIDRSAGLAGLAFTAIPVVFIAAGIGMLWGAIKPMSPAVPPAGSRPRLARRVALRVRKSRFYKLVESSGIGAFAALFVWIVSTSDAITGAGALVGAVAAAGIVLFAVARMVHAALGLLNPEAKVDVESTALALGEVIRIRWSLTGKVDRIRRLTIAVEVREELEYGSGKRRRLLTEQLARLPIVDLSSSDMRDFGSESLTIPKHLMHSLTTRGHRIAWVLRLNADIPNWTDIDDEFSLEIQPSP